MILAQAHSKRARSCSCYALLLKHYRENKEMEPCRTLVRCSPVHMRKPMEFLKLNDAQKVVSKTHILIVIEGAFLCVHCASSSNRSVTCLVAFELSSLDS